MSKTVDLNHVFSDYTANFLTSVSLVLEIKKLLEGKIIVGDEEPYQYLVDTIEKFPPQEEFSAMIENAGFKKVEYRNIFNGVVAIHSGWKE